MNRAGSDWATDEIEIILEDYLDMLLTELRGGKFNKAERNRALQHRIRRSRGSIEYKHQNISAVMSEFGLPFVWGYKPASNFQDRLFQVIGDRLLDGTLLDRLSGQPGEPTIPSTGLQLQHPPAKRPRHSPSDPAVRRILQVFDPAARDARSRELGEAGERFLYHAEQNRLSAAGRDDLAGKVRWVSKEDGDGAGYDILSFSTTGDKRWLEVKTTNGPRTTPFWISRNELRVSEEHADVFRLARLHDFSRAPAAYQLRPPLSDHVHLAAAQYYATF